MYMGGFKEIILTVGCKYTIDNKICEFIKVTERGYNFKMPNQKNLFKRSLYPVKRDNSDLPENSFKFLMLRFIDIKKINNNE